MGESTHGDIFVDGCHQTIPFSEGAKYSTHWILPAFASFRSTKLERKHREEKSPLTNRPCKQLVGIKQDNRRITRVQ